MCFDFIIILRREYYVKIKNKCKQLNINTFYVHFATTETINIYTRQSQAQNLEKYNNLLEILTCKEHEIFCAAHKAWQNDEARLVCPESFVITNYSHLKRFN